MNDGVWFSPMEGDPGDDGATAKMMFACLMRVSGSRKNIGYTTAENPEQFAKIMSEPASFSACRLILSQELSTAPEELSIGHLRQVNEATIATFYDVFDRIHRQNGGFGPDARSAAREFHSDTLRTLANYASFAAHVRGGNLKAVPALEPKSITLDPAIIYPFSDEILSQGY